MVRLFAAILLAALLSAGSGTSLSAQGDQKADKPPAWMTKVIGTGANSKIIEQFSSTLTETEGLVTSVQERFKKRDWLAKDLNEATERLTEAQFELRKFADGLTPKLIGAKALLSKFGPPPKEGQAEPDPLADQRRAIADEVGAYDALIKQAEVLRVQAGQVITNFNKRRRNRFVSDLLRQSEGFNQSQFWNDAVTAAPRQMNRLLNTVSHTVRSRLTAPW